MKKFNTMVFPDLSVWQKQQLENRLSIIKLASDKRLRANQLFNRYIRETDFYKGLSDSAFSRQQVDDRIATVQGFVRFMAKVNIKTHEAFDFLQELKHKKESQVQKTGIVISSIHRSKGLEWPVVILPALTAHYYPYKEKSDMHLASSIESERRLFYVAMTRAVHQLHLIAPNKEGSQHEVSPFIESMHIPHLLNIRQVIQNGKEEIALPKILLDSVNRYIKALNWPLKAIELIVKRPTVKKQVTFTDKTSLNTDDLKERINHRVFGNGLIEFETERHWHVQFDDGQLRVLDKKISDQHLSWI